MDFKNLVVFTLIFISAKASENEIPVDILQNLVLCSNDGGLTGVMNCAVSRALKSLEIASKVRNFEIFPGVSFEGDVAVTRSGKELNEETLPTNPQEKALKLTTMLIDAAARFVSGRTLKMKFSPTSAVNIARALEEGRGKMKKMMGPLLLGIGAKLMAVIPLLIGGLALVSTKALIVAKIAFVLAMILFVQSFFSSGFGGLRGVGHGFGGNNGGYGGHGTGYGYGYGGWTTNQLGNQYPYARSIEVAEDSIDEQTAQDMAYSKQN